MYAIKDKTWWAGIGTLTHSKSRDSSPLDYYFWEMVETKAYEDRLNTLFESEEEMSSK